MTARPGGGPVLAGALLALATGGGCASAPHPEGVTPEASPPSGRGSPRIVFIRGGAGARDLFEARQLDRGFLSSPAARELDWNEVFQVFVENPAASGGEVPAMAGSVRLEGEVLRFEPRFGLTPGIRYRARLRSGPWLREGSEQGAAIEEVFTIPAPPLERKTVVTQVYPTASRLPENQLKFYLHFSGPMSRRQAYERVHLLDAEGKVVVAPFLEIGEELWDPTGTRFTLFFDPGRVKRGLRPHEDLGPPLEAGKKYALVIDAEWLDAAGAPLKEPFRKEFEVGPPDYDPPDPRKWRIVLPAAGGNGALLVALPEPLDHALLHRLLRVRAPSGEVVGGEVTVGREEREWSFTPDAPWTAGRHQLLVDRALEDLAGNGVGRPFEVDATRNISSRVVPETVAVPFEVAAGAAGR